MPDDKRGSLELAHEYIPISYDWMLSRIASAETRVDSLMTQSAAVLVASVVAVTAINQGNVPISWTLAAGTVSAGLFLVVTLLGIKARIDVRLHMTNPGSFIKRHPGYKPETWVEQSSSEFIARMLEEADKDTAHNTKTIDKIGERCEWMGRALILEVITSLLWVILSPIY